MTDQIRTGIAEEIVVTTVTTQGEKRDRVAFKCWHRLCPYLITLWAPLNRMSATHWHHQKSHLSDDDDLYRPSDVFQLGSLFLICQGAAEGIGICLTQLTLLVWDISISRSKVGSKHLTLLNVGPFTLVSYRLVDLYPVPREISRVALRWK